ncbi:YlmC/YmxH family sporulation protein [Peribacillus kribbensis]|uniref:YlmC/YmxH family sporulation protein n=1 Tax=Peribacillus kribbensis TaxID=356658 RepID=UPI00047BD088|nr:YlmC/YmxH family sporulation protein [Peribacillus kribbensis]
MFRISEMQMKDIISISDGKKLGSILDLEVDIEKGIIEGLIVSGSQKLKGIFKKEEDEQIPWNRIIKIGEDVIIIKNHTSLNPFQE